MKRRLLTALPIALAALWAAVPAPLSAAEGSGRVVLRFPKGSEQGFRQIAPVERLRLPLGPFVDGRLPAARVTGRVERQVWTTPPGVTQTLGILDPLRRQLEAEGYTVLFECATRECGGFDFRFQTDVVEEPEMHVDLGDYRFLSAVRGTGPEAEYVTLMVSRSTERGYVQVTTIGRPVTPPPEVSASTRKAVTVAGTVAGTGLIEALTGQGKAVLEGVHFGKGSADLGGDPVESLQQLAAWLKADSARHVVLVGHTDAVGALEGNIRLSKKRAEAVMRRLIDGYGVDPVQLSAEGIGYLSPRATNATEEGRRLNRRVEVVLLSGE